jgi:hypothetical protein
MNSIWNKEVLPDQLKESIIVPIYKKGDETDCNAYLRISLLSTSCNILLNILFSRYSPYMKLFGIISVGFDITDQLLIRFSTIVRYCNGTVHHLFIDLKEAYDSMYNILM